MASAPYIGNQDFRGYLNFLSQSAPYSGTTNNLAAQALNFTGNDAGINEGALAEYVQAAPNDTNPDTYYQQQARDFVGKAYNDYKNYNTGVLGESTTNTNPYQTWGSQDNYNQLMSGFNNQKQNIYGSSTDAANALQGGYGQSIQDTIHNLQLGQQGIDRKAVQNVSSKIQGTRNILDMVGRGIRSGGVMLANRNAGNSSAAGALANAYGQQGQRQLSNIGNQFAANQGDIATAQAEQDYQRQQAPNKFHVQLMNDVNTIVNNARDKFAQLDAAMVNASMPDRIAIEQEKENVRQQVLGQLQQYDTQLASGVQGVQAQNPEQIQTTATQQLQAGQADPNLFQYNTQTPAQFQGSGPFASELPLFSAGRKRTA